MEESNTRLDEKVISFCEQQKKSGTAKPNYAEVMEFAIRVTLEIVEHFVKSKRWHEGMVLGGHAIKCNNYYFAVEKLNG